MSLQHLFEFPSNIEVPIPLFAFFQFYFVVGWDSKVHNSANSLSSLLIIIRSARLAEIRGSVCISKSHRGLRVSFSKTDLGLYIYHLFVGSNFNFLHNFQWITLLRQSCLVLYSFCANLLHSFIIWLIVSTLSLHNLHLLFCCVLSIFALISLFLMALFCATISHVHVFSCEMSFVSRLKRR